MERGIHRRTPIVLSKRLILAFWRGVRIGPGCWEWTGADRGNGYGALGLDGRVLSPHRVSYALHFGEPPAGQVIRHGCDNRRCCNPLHLQIGTARQNSADASRRGRLTTWSRKPIPSELVAEILRLRSEGLGRIRIARELGIPKSTVRNILAGTTRKTA